MSLKRIPAGSGFQQLTEAVTTEYGQLVELVRQALAEKLRGTPGSADYYVNVQGIWPDRVVALLRGRTFSYAYSIDAENKVAIGEGQEVVVAYTPVREAQAGDLLAAFREAADGSIEVTLIRAGASGNRNYYPDAALRDAAALFEGVRVFAKSDEEHTSGRGKDVRGLVGGIYGVRFVEGASPDTGSLVGTFKAIDPADRVVVKMTEAVKRGMQGLMGLSIDAVAKTKPRTQGAQRLRQVERFTRVHSVDLIVEPGAGGGLDRLTEAAAPTTPIPNQAGELKMPLWKQRMLEAIQAKDPGRHAALPQEQLEDAATDDQVVQLYEAVCGPLLAPPAGTRTTEAQGAADDELNRPLTRADLVAFQAGQAAAARIQASKLPQASKDRLAAQFAAGTARVTEAEVDTAIKAEGEYIARLTESGTVRVPVFGAGSIQVGDRSVATRDMLDAFFDPAHKDHGQVRSFREAYIEITGDRRVTGDVRNVDMSRLRESLGEDFREAIGSGTFANALGNSITRRMQAIFTGLTKLDAWRKVCTWGPVSDFRTQERMRIGGYGNLPMVGQSGAYQALNSPGDEKATYAVAKRGGTETVTLEAIKNDDVQALRRIPMELALAAKNTLCEFVFDFFRTNPVTYDTFALYHAANHFNLFTAPLDATQYAAHRLAMLKQTRAGSAKRLGAEPAAILVPFELQETAYNLFIRNQNNDRTFVQSINPEVIPVSYWTDPTDWATVADPNVLPVLEIGFLDGNEEPQLFVQDLPNVGSLFSNDTITYKIRHVYGGDILVDGWKGTTKAVVAG